MDKTKIYKFQMSMELFFENLKNNEIFRNDIINIFMECEHDNVYWEFPPFFLETKQNVAKFAIIKCGNFGKSNSASFKNFLNNKKDNEIVIFKNLSGDTDLITINSVDPENPNFCHIMKFMKNSSHKNKHQLLKTIGKEMLKYSNNIDPIYLSTHGHGVPWLHVRISKFRKYYVSNI